MVSPPCSSHQHHVRTDASLLYCSICQTVIENTVLETLTPGICGKSHLGMASKGAGHPIVYKPPQTGPCPSVLHFLYCKLHHLLRTPHSMLQGTGALHYSFMVRKHTVPPRTCPAWCWQPGRALQAAQGRQQACSCCCCRHTTWQPAQEQ